MSSSSSSSADAPTAQLLNGRSLTAEDGDIVPCGTGVIAVVVRTAAQLGHHPGVSTAANFATEQVVVIYPTEDAPRKPTGKEGVVVRDSVREGHRVTLTVTYDGGTANSAAAILLPREDDIACVLDR